MPPVRTPTEVLQINGSGKKHPERVAARKRAPKTARPIGAPPKRLTDDEKELWIEVVDEHPPGVLKATDRQALEVLSILFAKFRRREQLTGAELSKILNCLSLLGMTPVDRSRVILADEAQEQTAFGEFGKASHG
jgi:hypothetical protein